MAVICKMDLFVSGILNCEELDPAILEQEEQESEQLFKKILFEATDTKDIQDVPTEKLLQLALMTEYYYGDEAPRVRQLREQIKTFRSVFSVRRMRVL